MSIALPNLDDRQWADLVEEGLALIPRFSPDWTDHNAHDPGIMLIELMAWLSEMSIFRLNQIPATHRKKFLRLIGIQQLPATALKVIISPEAQTISDTLLLPAGTELSGLAKNGQTLRFRSLHEVNLANIKLRALATRETNTNPETATPDTYTNHFDSHSHTRSFLPFGDEAFKKTEPALYFGFDQLPTNTALTMAIKCEGGRSGEEYRRAIIEEQTNQLSVNSYAIDNSINQIDLIDRTLEHHSVKLVWEVLTSVSPEIWTALTPVEHTPHAGEVFDTTRALTLDGIIEFNLPESAVKTALAPEDAELFYLRCRKHIGQYDSPPFIKELLINAFFAEQSYVVSQRVAIIDNADLINDNLVTPGSKVKFNFTLNKQGKINHLRFLNNDQAPEHPNFCLMSYQNAALPVAEPAHAHFDFHVLGQGDGLPEQHFSFDDLLQASPTSNHEHAKLSLLIEDLEILTHFDGQWQTWQRREDFDASKRTDFHYIVDETLNSIRFGDGEQGRVIEAGAVVVLRGLLAFVDNLKIDTKASLSFAQNTSNNALLTEDAFTVLAQTTMQLTPYSPAQATETLEKANARAIKDLHAHDILLEFIQNKSLSTLADLHRDEILSLPAPARAINLLDIERLSYSIPGTDIARVRALAASHPALPCLHAEGVVTVVIIPNQRAQKPQPSAGLCALVKCFLKQRTLIATQIEVTGPKYVEVKIKVKIKAQRNVDIARLENDVNAALKQFLDPLHGGSKGTGWLFGHSVYRSKLLALIDQIPGVEHVLNLTIQGDGGEALCGNLKLCSHAITTSANHHIEIVRHAL